MLFYSRTFLLPSSNPVNMWGILLWIKLMIKFIIIYLDVIGIERTAKIRADSPEMAEVKFSNTYSYSRILSVSNE